MKFCVVGNEFQLLAQCRTILEETAAEDWSLIQSACYSESPDDADVYIWDFASDPSIPTELPDIVTRSLFVVEPGQLHRFREALGRLRASIVLKPVQLPALRPFVEYALRQRLITLGKQSITHDRPSRHEDRDDLLESVLHVNLKLQQYDQSRTNFLARALHDFRAPLTALDGYCGLLIDQRIGSVSPEQVNLLRRMQHSVRRLSGLTDAMFELSAGRQSKPVLNVREADVEASIHQAIHEVAQHAQQKQIRVSATVARPGQPFLFDSGKIEQVLINLLENSCKFTPKQGSVEVSAYPVAWEYSADDGTKSVARSSGSTSETLPLNAYRIDVRDSGSGIPVEHVHSIFEEYTTYSGGKDRSGGGLGLAICRMIVNAHQGAIWAQSDETGTQFSLVLPYGRSVSTMKMTRPSVRLNSRVAAANSTKLSA